MFMFTLENFYLSMGPGLAGPLAWGDQGRPGGGGACVTIAMRDSRARANWENNRFARVWAMARGREADSCVTLGSGPDSGPQSHGHSVTRRWENIFLPQTDNTLCWRQRIHLTWRGNVSSVWMDMTLGSGILIGWASWSLVRSRSVGS